MTGSMPLRQQQQLDDVCMASLGGEDHGCEPGMGGRTVLQQDLDDVDVPGFHRKHQCIVLSDNVAVLQQLGDNGQMACINRRKQRRADRPPRRAE